MVFAARLTQRGHRIAYMADLERLYEQPYTDTALKNIAALPHPTVQKFAVITVAIVGASLLYGTIRVRTALQGRNRARFRRLSDTPGIAECADHQRNAVSVEAHDRSACLPPQYGRDPARYADDLAGAVQTQPHSICAGTGRVILSAWPLCRGQNVLRTPYSERNAARGYFADRLPHAQEGGCH